MAIFHRTRVFGFRFWFLVLLSILLMLGDHKRIAVEKIKPTLEMVVAPLQEAVTLPERAFVYVRDYLILQHELVHDKKNWQSQKLILEAQLQQMNALKIQNQELQSLLKTAVVEQDQKYLLAKVIGINSDGLSHQIILNHGSKAGVTTGQAVISANGVVGQIVQVNPLNCRVMLLNDSTAAIPVMNERTHENLIVVGNGSDMLQILSVASGSDIKVGDLLLSSGMGGHFPVGYPVGTVQQVINKGSEVNKIMVKPAANLNQLQMVLVVFADNAGAQNAAK